MLIRGAKVSDAAAMASLWRRAGLSFDRGSVPAELALVLAANPELVLVAEDRAGQLAGTVLGTFDGRRGWVNRVATRPDMQRKGVATTMLAELERRLRALGCVKVNLLIERDNNAVAAFYERLGYRRDDLVFMEKWIGRQAERAPSWTGLDPVLAPGPYVFAITAEVPAGVTPFALVREDEALTLVLPRADADAAGLGYDYVAARITLRINSGLAAVGLTAAVSRVLAQAGISCNVIAGAAHDHLFTAWARRDDALTLLRNL